ncbi:hypothetical protein TSUD_245820 [Trifolium subterraneum]|uniref:Uncharacterized protein n=1 Tax=Trifolium subterraneum TaxID=3900 RepID=A0A2Z6NU41_TRISU|nr:hypothetical protein TSUD_245820 [Trifolium subterraneum]
MVFTPLLASTCVGTLEFRSVAEPVARIQPAVSNEPGSFFFLANCTGINADKHEFRSVAEPVARIQPAISNEPGSFFFLANCTGINADKHEEIPLLNYVFEDLAMV